MSHHEKKETLSSFADLAEALDVDLDNKNTEKDNPASTDAALQQALEEAKEKIKEADNKFLRLQAEMANFSKRMERELDKARQFALEKFVRELLAVLDSFEQGLQVPEKGVETIGAMKEGMALTYQMLLSTIEKFHVTQLNPVDESYNPHQHEAIGMIEAPDKPANTVIEVIQKGYILHGRLVRPARVIVSKA